MKECDKFFDEMKIFYNRQEELIKEGQNNYNLLTTVRKFYEEVGLHSSVIASLLDRYGHHYRGGLFLKLFLESIGASDFGLKIEQTYTKKEYLDIDIYISDGSKHIIIENKVYAGDQKHQIKRYVDKIREINPRVTSKDLLVIYLSIDRIKLDEDTLDDLKIEKNQLLRDKEPIAQFINIHYKKQIIEWLEKCEEAIKDIQNLKESIRQYKEVVQMISKSYKGNVMGIESKIKESRDIYAIAKKTSEEFISLVDNKVKEFFEEVEKGLREKLVAWQVELKDKKLKEQHEWIFHIYKATWKNKHIIFAFQFDNIRYCNGKFGIVKSSDKIKINPNYSNFCQSDFKERVENLIVNDNGWWLLEDRENLGSDLAKELIFSNINPISYTEHILKIIEQYEPVEEDGLITAINNSLVDKSE